MIQYYIYNENSNNNDNRKISSHPLQYQLGLVSFLAATSSTVYKKLSFPACCRTKTYYKTN
jgi:hypothetical protein